MEPGGEQKGFSFTAQREIERDLCLWECFLAEIETPGSYEHMPRRHIRQVSAVLSREHVFFTIPNTKCCWAHSFGSTPCESADNAAKYHRACLEYIPLRPVLSINLYLFHSTELEQIPGLPSDFTARLEWSRTMMCQTALSLPYS